MVEARVAEPGPYARHSWRRLLRRAGATFAGLRLLDGTLVLKVSRGPRDGADRSDRRRRLRPGAERPRGRHAEGRLLSRRVGPGREPGPDCLAPVGRPVVAVARRVTAKGRRRTPGRRCGVSLAPGGARFGVTGGAHPRPGHWCRCGFLTGQGHSKRWSAADQAALVLSGVAVTSPRRLSAMTAAADLTECRARWA